MANIPNSGGGGGNSSSTQGNLLFRKRWGQIDWRKIASVDVDKVAQEMDFQALQDNIMSIAFCNVETEFLGLDPNFVKLFRMGQLIIEYLLHSQQYLSKQSNLLEQQCQQIKEEQVVLKEEMDRLNDEKKAADINLKAVQKENRKRRKVIEAYQDMMNAGATGLHPCPVCKREFISMEFLKSHLDRRHPEQVSRPDKEISKNSQEELETRLLQQMMDHLHASEKQLRDEMKQKEIEAKEAQATEMKEWKEIEQKRIMSSHQEHLEEWKVEESRRIKDAQLVEFEEWEIEARKKMMVELEELKKPMLNELGQVHKENLKLEKDKLRLEKALQKKEEELANALAGTKRQSHVGHLEGAKEILLDEVDMEQQNESSAGILSLKESVEKEMQNMRTLMKKRDASWKKRISELCQYQHSLSEATSKPEVLDTSMADTALVSKEIESLKNKQKKQEHVLKIQQDELESLRKKNSSLIKSTAKPVTSTSEPVTVLPNRASQSESIDSHRMDDEDRIDFEDKLKFSSHCPMIKTMYQHSSADMEKIREQTHALFCEALLEKNIEENRVGLKTADLETKMALLHQERKQRYSNCDEHRQRISEKLEEYCSSHFPQATSSSVDKSTEKLLHVKGGAAGKPPKPSKVVSYQPEYGTSLDLGSSTGKMFDDSVPTDSDSSAEVSLSYQQDDATPTISASNSQRKLLEPLPAPIVVKERIEDNDPSLEEDSDTDEESVTQLLGELTDLDDSEEGKAENYKMVKSYKREEQARKSDNAREGFFDAITGSSQPSSSAKAKIESKTAKNITGGEPLNNTGIKITQKKEQDQREDSPWDSTDENSVKDLAVPRMASSTPMKGKGGSQIRNTSSSNVAVPAENVSLDSFDLSSSNEPGSTIPHKAELDDKMGHFDGLCHGVGLSQVREMMWHTIDSAQSSTDKLASLSKNATSQSALTNVSLDEFDLSDLSDIM